MDKIKLLEPLGSGGNSRVFLGKEISTGRKVTVKMCKSGNLWEADKYGNAEAGEKNVKAMRKLLAEKKNLDNEARILEGLDHDGIPKLYQRSSEGIVLEFIPGISLEKVLFTEGVLTEKEAARVGCEIAEILRYLHGRRQPVIYRDLKPANIVRKLDGHVCLIDFGAARFYEALEKSDTLNLGTLGFAAPEQFGNLGQTDPRTDIYCLGMTLLQLVSGANVGDQEEVTSFLKKGIKGVSPEFLGIIKKCTRPDREDRFRSVKEIEKALLEYPKKVRLRKAKSGIKVVVAAVMMSLVISGCLIKGEAVREAAANDMAVRLPAVRERLFAARIWIEGQVENILDSEVLQKK